MSNIFRNLIRNEDNFTEGLVNLLDLSGELRSHFYNIVRKSLGFGEGLVAPEDFVGNTISTQKAINGPRPDIIVENDSAIIIFEAKIDPATGLTKNQKKLYIDSFNYLDPDNKNNHHIIFILPRKYIHLTEVEKLIKMSNNSAKSVNDKNEIKKAAILYWEDIQHECISPAIEKGDTVERYLLEQYSNLLESRLKILNIAFTTEEIEIMNNPKTISVFIKLTKLIERIRTHDDWKHWMKATDSLIELYLQNKNYNGIHAGFIINYNSEAKCLEDHIEIRVWRKPLSDKVLMDNDKEIILKSEDKDKSKSRYIYKFKEGSIAKINDNGVSDEAGNRIMSIITQIMDSRFEDETE